MSEATWSDGYVLALGEQISRDWSSRRDRLLATDPAAPLDALDLALEAAERLGAKISSGNGERSIASPEASIEVARVRALTGLLREVGARTFDEVEERDDHIVSTTRWPLAWLSLPDNRAFDEVELLNVGDTPPDHPLWQGRARIAELRSLRVLYLYGNVLDAEYFDIPLDGLSALEVLDLGDNRLRSVPRAVAACTELRSLRLIANPLSDIGALHDLKSLRYLELARTSVDRASVDALRTALPDCRVSAPQLD